MIFSDFACPTITHHPSTHPSILAALRAGDPGGMHTAWVLMAFFSSSLAPAPAPTPALTERARLGTFRGFGTERARLGTFRGFGTERARLDTLEALVQNVQD